MASLGNVQVYDPQLGQTVSLELKQYIYVEVGDGSFGNKKRSNFLDSLQGKVRLYERDEITGCANVAVYPVDHIALAADPGEFNG